MTNNCYIDGTGLHDSYGIVILKGGYNDLLSFPPLREPHTEDWPEEDGVDPDLYSPALQPKTVTIPFIQRSINRDRGAFIEMLSQPGYRNVYIPSLDRQWQLRLVSEPTLVNYKHKVHLSVRFAQDNILRPSPVIYSPGLPVRPSSYELDDIPFHEYGLVIEEARDSLLQSPTAKLNMNREVRALDGRIYDADILVFKSKEVRFKCFLKAVSKQHFWQCYDAFFNALTAPGQRELYAEHTSELYPCHYHSTSGWNLVSLSPMMVEFTLVLTFISFRVGSTDYLLASEAGDLIITETGEYAIDLLEYGY